jgi:hypothetical protein
MTWMEFLTQLKENAEGELYITIPEQLNWREHDQIQLTITTDLDTNRPAILLVNISDRERNNLTRMIEDTDII